jgi:hypothetical protein
MMTLIILGGIIFALVFATYVAQVLLFVGRILWVIGTAVFWSLCFLFFFVAYGPKKAMEIWKKANAS